MDVGAKTLRPVIGSRSLSRRSALVRCGSALLAVAVLASTPRETVQAQATPAAGAVAAVARQAIEAVNAVLATGETTALDAVFAPDVAGHPPHRSLVTGEPFSHDLAGLKAGLADIRRFFPDATIAIEELITSDDIVAARITFRGTLDAMGPEGSAETNAPLEIGGLLYGRVEDGHIAEFWAYFDPSAYLDLIGLLSGAAQATPDASSGHSHGEAASTGRIAVDAEVVLVTVTEFSIALTPTPLHAGRPYAFVVSNEGTVEHEFVIERAGATHDPLMSGDQVAMATGIAPGDTRTLGWTFAEPGSYQLACHQPGHYEAGQVLSFEVGA